MKLSRLTLVLAAAATLAAGVASAHPRPSSLTPEQREEVRTILERHRAEGLADAAQRARDARRELRQVLRQSAPDETALREAYRRAAKAGEDVAILRMKARQEALSVLTPEQQEQLRSRSWRRGGRRIL